MSVEKGILSYHIDCAERILADNQIEHKPLGQSLEIQENWLPQGEILVGITSGASTPDKVVEEVIERIFSQKLSQV
jgi:4-hydroxy-3-methylbut-2-enyl diphosphate reductase